MARKHGGRTPSVSPLQGSLWHDDSKYFQRIPSLSRVQLHQVMLILFGAFMELASSASEAPGLWLG